MLRLCDDGLAKLDIADQPWLRDVKGVAQGPNGWVSAIGYRGVFGIKAADLDLASSQPHAPLPHFTIDDDDQRVGVPQRKPGLQAIAGQDGRTWLLTRQGVLSLPPGGPLDASRPVAYVRSLATADRDYAHPAELRLPKGTSSVGIEYGAVDLITPAQRRFRVILDGVDTQWTDLADRRQVTFAHLGPGDYRFRVETDDRQGRWIEPGAKLGFSI